MRLGFRKWRATAPGCPGKCCLARNLSVTQGAFFVETPSSFPASPPPLQAFLWEEEQLWEGLSPLS